MWMDELSRLLSSAGGPRVVVAVVVAVALLGVLKRVLWAPKADPHLKQVVCSCGWRGTVSRYKPVCPKCGNRDGLMEA